MAYRCRIYLRRLGLADEALEDLAGRLEDLADKLVVLVSMLGVLVDVLEGLVGMLVDLVSKQGVLASRQEHHHLGRLGYMVVVVVHQHLDYQVQRSLASRVLAHKLGFHLGHQYPLEEQFLFSGNMQSNFDMMHVLVCSQCFFP